MCPLSITMVHSVSFFFLFVSHNVLVLVQLLGMRGRACVCFSNVSL